MAARSSSTATSARIWSAAVVILLAAAALRMADLGGWSMWLDESWSRWMTETGWPGLRARAAAYDTHPPVHYSVLKAWRALGADGPFGMRLLSALAGMATVGLT